jgi:hypothetical protein
MPVSTSKKLRIVEFYSPPFGITDFYQDLDGKFCQDLGNKLMNHIQKIAEGKRNYGEVTYGNTSGLTWDVYEAIRCYQCANPTVNSSFLPFLIY